MNPAFAGFFYDIIEIDSTINCKNTLIFTSVQKKFKLVK